MLTRRTALLIPGALAIASCQRPTLHVDMIGPADAAWISARASGWFGVLTGSVEIVGVTVHEAEGWVETTKVWEIYRDRNRDEKVRRIQYGTLPAGFIQGLAPQTLSDEATYSVTVASSEGNEGFLYFAVANGRVV